VATVVARLDAAVPCDGVTLSGGEPLEQPEAAIAVLDAARARGLSTMAFSGYTIDEIRTQPLGPDVLSRLDVLVDGRYDASRSLRRELRGSSNQVIHCLTARYTHAELAATPIAEIVIGRDGLVQLSGVDPLRRLR
jgi:anaerobic ribonucleoside-triphosphate reductase activating protein